VGRALGTINAPASVCGVAHDCYSRADWHPQLPAHCSPAVRNHKVCNPATVTDALGRILAFRGCGILPHTATVLGRFWRECPRVTVVCSCLGPVNLGGLVGPHYELLTNRFS